MPGQRGTSRGSRRSVPLYVLLLSTLALAGILGFQAYDAARSHRATAQQALRDYAQLANWRYQDWAYWIIEKSLADVFSPLGYNYEVHMETLCQRRKALNSIGTIKKRLRPGHQEIQAGKPPSLDLVHELP